MPGTVIASVVCYYGLAMRCAVLGWPMPCKVGRCRAKCGTELADAVQSAVLSERMAGVRGRCRTVGGTSPLSAYALAMRCPGRDPAAVGLPRGHFPG
eukprot:3180008-Rhodomonas_salina.1